MGENRILALVPARGNSKGIPRKNVKEMAGKPLIAWTILAAAGSRYRMRLVCSTDDPEIAETARQWGAETPFLRPDHLSTDDAPTLGAVLHAVESLEDSFTHVLLLQPTSPLRTSADIDGAIRLSLERSADAVVSVTEARTHPYLTYSAGSNGIMSPFCRSEGISLRRQDLPAVYELNGAIYFNRVDSLVRDRTFLPAGALAYPMPHERSIDIDDSFEWNLAEQVLRERQ